MEQRPYRKEIGPGGRIVIPAKVREACGFEEGDEILIRVVDGEAHLYTQAHAIRKAQEYFRQFKTPGKSVVDELIAVRRGEAKREEEEYSARVEAQDPAIDGKVIDLNQAFSAEEETEEILSDPEMMALLRQALEEMQAGEEGISHEQLLADMLGSVDDEMADLIERLKDPDLVRGYVGEVVEECIRSADWLMLVLATKAVIKAQTGREVAH